MNNEKIKQLEERISILEFEKEELRSVYEEKIKSEQEARDKDLNELREKHQKRVQYRTQNYDAIMRKFEQLLAEKEHEFQVRLKSLEKADSISVSGAKALAAKLIVVEQKLSEAAHTIQLEKNLMTQRLTMAKEEFKSSRLRFQETIESLRKENEGYRDRIDTMELEFMQKEANLHKEWNADLEAADQQSGNILAHAEEENIRLKKSLAAAQKDIRKYKRKYKELRREMETMENEDDMVDSQMKTKLDYLSKRTASSDK